MKINDIIELNELLDEAWYDKKNLIGAATALGIGAGAASLAPTSDIPNSAPGYQPEIHMDLEHEKSEPKKEPSAEEKFHSEVQGLEPKDVKKKFIQVVLPSIKEVNDEIRQERLQVIEALKAKPRSAEQNMFLNSMFQKYKVQDQNPKELLQKVDIIPEPIALAQAGLESHWGTSRLAKEANVLYGQKTTAKDAAHSETDAYAKFGGFKDAIRSYAKNLNTHDAYDGFREVRYKQRANGKLNPNELVHALGKYSTKGKGYIRTLLKVMNHNKNDLK